jgi:hypothetical protein
MIHRLLTRVRAFPENLLFVAATYFGAILTLTSWTPTIPPVSDFVHYVNMANGIPAPDPFGRRILVPFLASLFGGTPYVFHYMNVVLLTLATCVLYLYNDGGKKGFITGLLFLSCTRAIVLTVGEPVPDAMTYLLLALMLYLTKIEHKWGVILIAPLAAATHPIAFVIVNVIWVVHVFPDIVKILFLMPGVIVFILLLPQSYGTLYIPDIVRILWMAKSLGILWIGFLGIRKNRDGVQLLMVIACCFGFSLLATNVDRIFSFLGLFLSPLLANIIFGESEKALTVEE